MIHGCNDPAFEACGRLLLITLDLQHLRLSSHDLTYGNGVLGSKRLRAAASRFINNHFHPVRPIDSSQIVFTAGVTNAIEVTGWSLGDPGDGVLLGRPYYTAFVNDLGTRAGSVTIISMYHLRLQQIDLVPG